MQRGNAFMLTNATTSCKVRLARKKLTNDSSSKKEHVERQGPSGQRSRPGGPTFMFLKLLMMISGWFNCCYWPDFFFLKVEEAIFVRRLQFLNLMQRQMSTRCGFLLLSLLFTYLPTFIQTETDSNACYWVEEIIHLRTKYYIQKTMLGKPVWEANVNEIASNMWLKALETISYSAAGERIFSPDL